MFVAYLFTYNTRASEQGAGRGVSVRGFGGGGGGGAEKNQEIIIFIQSDTQATTAAAAVWQCGGGHAPAVDCYNT